MRGEYYTRWRIKQNEKEQEVKGDGGDPCRRTLAYYSSAAGREAGGGGEQVVGGIGCCRLRELGEEEKGALLTTYSTLLKFFPFQRCS